MERAGVPVTAEQPKLKRMNPQATDDKGKGMVYTAWVVVHIQCTQAHVRAFTAGKDNVTEKEAEDEVEDVEEEVEVVMGDVPLFSLPEDYKFMPYFTVEEGEKMRYVALLVLNSKSQIDIYIVSWLWDSIDLHCYSVFCWIRSPKSKCGATRLTVGQHSRRLP